MTAEELGFLLRALDRPVGKKLTRFAEAVRDKQTGRLSCDIFHAITMPNEQISLLIEALHLVFQQDLDDSDQLKVVLARMKNKRVDAFEYYLPSTEGGPRTSVDELRVKESGFSRAAELQQIIIVPDLAKEMAKTKKSRNCVKGQRGRVTQAP